MPIRAGALARQIRIEAPVETPDGAGGSLTVWSLVAETSAAVSPLSGRELLEAGALSSDVTHRVLIRYRSGITPKCRVRLGDRVLRVNVVRDIEERHRELELSCTEVEAERVGAGRG